MKPLAFMRYAAVVILMLIAAVAAAADAPGRIQTLPSDSIYQLDLALIDQDGHSLTLRDRRGGPVLIAMFYSSCAYMCPLIVESIKRSEHTLDEQARARLRVVLVSFDSVRDTPPVLKVSAAERHIDLSRWTLARTKPADVRRLAAALDVQYRALPDGGFNHSGVLTLLDAEGRIAARTDKLGELDPEFVSALQRATAPESSR